MPSFITVSKVKTVSFNILIILSVPIDSISVNLWEVCVVCIEAVHITTYLNQVGLYNRLEVQMFISH